MLSTVSALPFFAALPSWVTALICALGVMLASALVGMLIGRAWASVRYPDPEKQNLLDPKLRLAFIALAILCAYLLYRGFAPAKEEAAGEVLPVSAMQGAVQGGGKAKATGDAMAITVAVG